MYTKYLQKKSYGKIQITTAFIQIQSKMLLINIGSITKQEFAFASVMLIWTPGAYSKNFSETHD